MRTRTLSYVLRASRILLDEHGEQRVWQRATRKAGELQAGAVRLGRRVDLADKGRREKLKARREPYWQRVPRGCYVGWYSVD